MNNQEVQSQYTTTHENDKLDNGSTLNVPLSLLPGTGSLSAYETNFKALEYVTNYTSLLNTILDDFQTRSIKLNNELQLSRYYEFKKALNNGNIRQNSVASMSDSSILQNEKNKNVDNIIDNFLCFDENSINLYGLRDSFNSHDNISKPNSYIRLDNLNSNEMHSDDNDQVSQDPSFYMKKSNFANSYYKYYKKLLTVDMKDHNILKKHNLWVPTLRRGCEGLLSQFETENSTNNNVVDTDIYKEKTCPLFITGSYNLPSLYEATVGHSILPSIFSEYKLPALSYHCSVEFNNRVFILGGLMACYRNDKEKPDIDNYFVDGIKNLPPPLLSNIINNPAMVNNPYLYVQSVNSNRLSRPEITGQIPPPLLCMTASKLTDRYLLFYGGIEIKTETNFNQNGNFFIKKRAFLNNTAYILDTVSFKFTKVEVNTQSFMDGKYSTFSSRFGHLQLPFDNLHHNPSTDNSLVDSSSTFTVNNTHATNNENFIDIQRRDSPSMDLPIEEVAKSMTPSTSLLNSDNCCIGNCNGYHIGNVFSILIFGGYRQTVDDKYEALNDMWRLDLNVIARGKKGFLKFADSVIASNLPVIGEEGKTPSPRAFFAYSLPNATLLGRTSLESELLKKLEEEFWVDSNLISEQYDRSTLLFPNIPHNGHGQKIDKVLTNSTNNSISTNSRTFTNSNPGSNLSKASSANYDRLSEKRSNTNESVTSNVQNQFKGLNVNSGHTESQEQQQENNKRTLIVVHGGSNNEEVFGDMWWLDLENLKWLKIDTYKKNANKSDIIEETELKLVGHNMVSSGYTGVFVGGMTQGTVNELYGGVFQKDEELMDVQYDTGIIHIINLKTQCILNGTVIENSTQHPELRLLSNVAGTAVQAEGSVILIGGILYCRQNVEDMYLRGALLEFMLPAMDLSV